MTNHPKPTEWIGDAKTGYVKLLDQTQLPREEIYVEVRDFKTMWQMIKQLSVRGAPAIGIAAAYGCVLGAQKGEFAHAAQYLTTSRPTAVNLFSAIERMKSLTTDNPEHLLREAKAIHAEDASMCEAIGRHTLPLIQHDMGILTHCNAGALATGGIGTATAGMYLAHAEGRKICVFAGETRPLLQGARITAWELSTVGIDVIVICDSAVASVLREDRVHLIITGADRIAANGDVANKIGTYPLAVMAHRHEVPFYVAAPSTTIDFNCPHGIAIPIEERNGSEITPLVRTYNPAFDVTPAELITGIITETGLHSPNELK
jgi:methylthioribose-1-phosphate isomerase